VSNGRLTVFTRQVVGAEGSSVANPVPGSESVVLIVRDTSGWGGWADGAGPPPEVRTDREGVVVGVTVSDDLLQITHRSVGPGPHSPPAPESLPDGCHSFTLHF
jgi:hypothetical protein